MSKASNWGSKYLSGDSVMVAFSIFAFCDIDVSWIRSSCCMYASSSTDDDDDYEMKKIMCSR